MSDLSLATVLHSVLGTRQRHHTTTVTAVARGPQIKASPNNCHSREANCHRTSGPQSVQRKNYRTEKTQRLKTQALRTKTLFGDKFLGYRRYPEGRFFWGVRRYPRRIFSTKVSEVTIADRARTQTSPQEVLFPGEINPKISFFLQVKREKK